MVPHHLAMYGNLPLELPLLAEVNSIRSLVGGHQSWWEVGGWAVRDSNPRPLACMQVRYQLRQRPVDHDDTTATEIARPVGRPAVPYQRAVPWALRRLPVCSRPSAVGVMHGPPDLW